MAMQGTADLAEMAKDLSEVIFNRRWADAIAEIKKLNGLQAIFLFDCLKQHLSAVELEGLVVTTTQTMNDGETGRGYISDSQFDDEFYEEEGEEEYL